MREGLIFDIKRFSVHDGPGIRTTVFFKGCPLTCSWCHNPESQEPDPEIMLRPGRCIDCSACVVACEQGAISRNGNAATTDRERCIVCGACVEMCYAEARELVGRRVTVAHVMAEVERDAPFYEQSGGGVTFSGGEPLQQAGFLLELLEVCKEREFHTAVDTSGCVAWETLDKVRGLIDLFLYDIKLIDDARHRQLTGVSNRVILDNLHALSQHGHAIYLRLPLIPGINDDDDNIRRTGELASALPSLARVDVLPYHHAGTEKYQRLGKSYTLPALRSPGDDRVTTIVEVLQGFGLQVQIGG